MKTEVPTESKVQESSRESEDGKEYLERLNAIERRVDQIKVQIGEVKVESFDKLQELYEQKHKEYIRKVEEKLIESKIKEKGLINVLTELKGSMNDSIRVLKCVTHEDHVWFLIEEDIDEDFIQDEDLQQYWIKETDLSAAEKEYIHQYLPSSMKEEDANENHSINKILKSYSKQLKELRDERKELLKECREIRFGLKITYYCMDEDFDEDVEQKLHDYDLKIIEYEDDITYLNENLQEVKLEVNDLQLKNQKSQKRIEELNAIIANISRGTNETVENFLKSYKKTNELIYKNQALQDEVEAKNEEIESLKNSSIVGRGDLGSLHEEDKSEGTGKNSHREYESPEIDFKGTAETRFIELKQENELLRSKIRGLEEDIMDIQNRNNLIMTQNQNLKNEVKELEAKLASRTSLTFEEETTKKSGKDIEHVKDILVKFLKETPITSKSNEQLLMIVLSMLYLNKPQMDEIHQSRKLLTLQYEEDILKKNKKPMFGGLFKRSNSKKK